MPIDQQFIEYIVKQIVDHPDEVVVDRTIDEKGVLLLLSVNSEDLGRVIGKRGSTAQALRTMLRALGTKNDARYNLKIVDPDRPAETQQSSTSESTDSAANDDVAADGAQPDEPTEPAVEVDEVEVAEVDEPEDDESQEEPSAAEKAREELAGLDDLDI